MATKKTRILTSIPFWGALALIAAALIWWQVHAYRQPPLDAPLRAALAKLEDVRSYVQHVETVMNFPDRALHVEGTYSVNEPAMTYSAISTTTLTIPDLVERPSFALHTISIGSDVYTTVSTESPLLLNSIPVGPWRHYKADAIPPRLAGIAISGPVLDNLKLLSQRGAYLTLITQREDTLGDATPLTRYTFRLSGRSPSGTGTVTALMERIASGTVDVWIEPTSSEIRYLVFSNPPYFSTTTLSLYNAAPEVLPPIADH